MSDQNIKRKQTQNNARQNEKKIMWDGMEGGEGVGVDARYFEFILRAAFFI